MEDESLIYTLTFNAPGYKFNELTVTSYNLDMLKKFIDVHLTPEAYDCIQVYEYNHTPVDIDINLSDTELSYYIFQDNGTDEYYSIPSSLEIITAVAAEVCRVLSRISKFDRLINLNMPMCWALNENIGDLKFGYILEPDYTPPPGSDAYGEYKKTINIGDEAEYKSEEMEIYNNMMNRVVSTGMREPLPFTIKGYVSAFTKLLIVDNKRR